MVTHQLQVERRTGKVRRSKTDVLPTVPRNQPVEARDQVCISSDCSVAIDMICNTSEISSHVQATHLLSSYLRSLDDIEVDVTLVLIPGHCDIRSQSKRFYQSCKPSHELTADCPDMQEYDYQAVSFSMTAAIGLVPCRSNNLRVSSQKLGEDQHIQQSADIIISISYARFSLNDTSLRGPMHRMGLASSGLCECGLGIGGCSSFFL